MVSDAIWAKKCNQNVLTNHGKNICRMDAKILEGICG
jgi:hypothetical protein